jgi:membrane protein DedA with SNARE-associated domain
MMAAVWTVLVPLLARMAGDGPEPEDVKAGWLGFTVFLLLAAAVAFLGFSLRKHLRKVDFEEQDGEPRKDAGAANGDHPTPV